MKAPSVSFSGALLEWYDRVARPLPWRATRDPYAVLVSEFMLQQTQVSTVIPYFERFMRRFPTVGALAAAEEEEVLAEWRGLGYYRRARNLHRAARALIQEYGGELPRTADALRRLPGVGAYTAAAVASIAFGQPVPVLDGNVLRVMARLLGEERPIGQAAVQRRMRLHLEAEIPADRPGDFNQALMELGATVCAPSKAECDSCPVAAFCAARAQGDPERLPMKSRRAKARTERRVAGVLLAGERLLLVQRPEGGLLGGLWEFPSVEGSGEEGVASLGRWIEERLGCRVEEWVPLGEVEHRFSHLHWTVEVAAARIEACAVAEAPAAPLAWVSREEIQEKAVSRAMQKVWALAAPAVAGTTPGPPARRGQGFRGTRSPRGSGASESKSRQ